MSDSEASYQKEVASNETHGEIARNNSRESIAHDTPSSNDSSRIRSNPPQKRRLESDDAQSFSSRSGKDSKSRLKSVYTAKVTKPAWLDEETYKKDDEKKAAPNQNGSSRNPGTGETKKLKRPSRRTNFNDQRKQASDHREKLESTTGTESNSTAPTIKTYENNDEAVRAFYNERVHIARKQIRILSPIIKMRNFNNAIKYMLIGIFAKPGDKVLDMGCGKGGDLNKWAMSQVSQYIGVDISDGSILEAIKRYRHLRDKQFPAIFATGDCYGSPIPTILQNFANQIQFPVDVVSMQFCMHYAFESEEKVRTMLTNVSKSLRRGGSFIGTIPSSDFIRQQISKLEPGSKKWGNSIYSVTFENDPPRDGVFRPPFGHKYTYYLEDAVDNVAEYVVPFEAFRAIAEEYDLELKYKKTFAELFAEEIPEWHQKLNRRLLDGMKRTDGSYGVEGEEAEASAFYLAFCFEKTGFE